MNRLKKLNKAEVRDDSYFRRHYGANAILTRLGNITLVHLDGPSPATIKERIEEITREEISGEALEADCPLCQMLADEPYEIVYPAKLSADD